MLNFAFWASLVLTAFKIGSFLKRPSLDLRLAPELFFRISDFGECLFSNPIYLAWNGPVLITQASAELNKTGSKSKKCPYLIHNFGEKTKGNSLRPDFYFHSVSPIQHVDESKPQRVVYMLIEDSQRLQIREKFRQLQQHALTIKENAKREYGEKTQIPNSDEILLKSVVAKLQAAADKFTTEIMDLVQLEPGDYVFSIKVSYRDPKAFFKMTRSVSSAVEFTVDPATRDLLRSSLNNCLYTMLTNYVSNGQVAYTYPEYQPANVRTREK